MDFDEELELFFFCVTSTHKSLLKVLVTLTRAHAMRKESSRTGCVFSSSSILAEEMLFYSCDVGVDVGNYMRKYIQFDS